MKCKKYIAVCKKKCRFDMREYDRVNNELLERMRGVFSHGFSLISMVGLLLTITATLIANFNFAENLENCLSSFLFAGLVVFLFGIPVFVLYPFSVKYRDNLRVIANLSAYIKVFFEYPRLLGKLDRYNGKNISRMAWETIHCGAKVGIKRMFGFEYLAAAVVSDVLVLISMIYIIAIEWNLYFLIIAGMYFAFLIFTTVFIGLNSRSTYTLGLYGQEYFLIYLTEAISWGVFTNDDADFCLKNYLRNVQRDEDIQTEMRFKRKYRKIAIINDKYQNYIEKLAKPINTSK